MKVSENWLRKWVNPDLDANQLASLLTMAGLEVDSCNPVAGTFDKVVVAEVIACKPHPAADKLSLCEVDNGQGDILNIVCGASNVRKGLKVALAEIGANLPDGFVIKEAKLRGELSQGMLCSLSELGLSDSSEGIMELDEDAPLGCNLRDYFDLNDQVLDIELTPNRADCLSVLGIAREISALTKAPLKSTLEPSFLLSTSIIHDEKTIHLQEKKACPRFCGRIIRNINTQMKTPLWMRERLRRSGIRSIHPVVDITNYVMLEFGQPMHAYDLNSLQGDVVVRYAKDQEKLKLLDGQEVFLKEDILVIADEAEVLSMAGIIGGKFSAVNENTQDIFLESAFFNPTAIAGVARRYGLFTDSSQRFERGVDPSLQEKALDQAAHWIHELLGGEVGAIFVSESSDNLPPKRSLLFHPAKVKQVTGMDIPEPIMADILKSLGLCVQQSLSSWEVSIPSYRFDLHLEVDLVEEILRIYGYNLIPCEKMTAVVSAGTINPFEALSLRLQQFFSARGYHETISYSFVDPDIQETLYPNLDSLKLLNPISPELSSMRLSLLPGLLASMIYNCHRQQASIRLFELGVIFEKSKDGVLEHPCLGGIMTGDYGSLNWAENTRKFDFFDLKGDLQALFAFLHLPALRFERSEESSLHPGKSARIMLNQQEIGKFGVLHPKITDCFNIQDEVIIFELRLHSMIMNPLTAFKPISKFPKIRRDLSLLADEDLSIGDIEACIRENFYTGWLKTLDIFDVYKGTGIPEGKKSLGIALTLQDDSRTLIDTEINAEMNAIIKRLTDQFAINLRE